MKFRTTYNLLKFSTVRLSYVQNVLLRINGPLRVMHTVTSWGLQISTVGGKWAVANIL